MQNAWNFFRFEVVSRRRFSDDVNHDFQWGKLCVVGSIHGILDVGSLEDDAETFCFCSSVPSSYLVLNCLQVVSSDPSFPVFGHGGPVRKLHFLSTSSQTNLVPNRAIVSFPA